VLILGSLLLSFIGLVVGEVYIGLLGLFPIYMGIKGIIPVHFKIRMTKTIKQKRITPKEATATISLSWPV